MIELSSQKEVLNLYERVADSYESKMDSHISEPVYKQLIEKIVYHSKVNEGAILDIGCGPGHILELIQNRLSFKRKLIGVDISQAMIEKARDRLGDSVKLFRADLKCLEQIDSNSCATILNFSSMHHFQLEEVDSFLNEWKRVLKPNGQLIIEAWEGTGKVKYPANSALLARRYTEEELTRLLTKHDFQVEESFLQYNKRRKMHTLYLVAYKP